MHSGTWAGDSRQGHKTHSQGCILLGFSTGVLSGQPGLVRSRPAVWDFMDNVLQGEPSQLRIVNQAHYLEQLQ